MLTKQVIYSESARVCEGVGASRHLGRALVASVVGENHGHDPETKRGQLEAPAGIGTT